MERADTEHRDPYLRELGEPTYLVIDPRVKAQLGPHRSNQANRLVNKTNLFSDGCQRLSCYVVIWVEPAYKDVGDLGNISF